MKLIGEQHVMPAPSVREVIIEHLDNPNVAIINVLDDPPTPPYNCQEWGVNGDSRIPIIVNDYPNGIVRNWFGLASGVCRNIFL